MYQLLKILVTLLLLCNLAHAKSVNEETLNIVADSTLINYKTGFDSYEGNVKIDQGGQHVIADKVTTRKNKHKISEAIAYGINKPARYWTIPEGNTQTFDAKAKIITYYPLQSLVILEGDVVITQGKNSFHGPLIRYNIKDQIVSAPANKNGRSTIIIEPKQLS